MVWLMVMNPAWLAPIVTAAKMDNSLVDDNASNIGPSPLVKPKIRKSTPRVVVLWTPARKMEVVTAPSPTAKISQPNPTKPACNFPSDMAGRMD